MLKKVLAFGLSLVMMLSLITTTAFAEEVIDVVEERTAVAAEDDVIFGEISEESEESDENLEVEADELTIGDNSEENSGKIFTTDNVVNLESSTVPYSNEEPSITVETERESGATAKSPESIGLEESLYDDKTDMEESVENSSSVDIQMDEAMADEKEENEDNNQSLEILNGKKSVQTLE